MIALLLAGCFSSTNEVIFDVDTMCGTQITEGAHAVDNPDLTALLSMGLVLEHDVPSYNGPVRVTLTADQAGPPQSEVYTTCDLPPAVRVPVDWRVTTANNYLDVAASTELYFIDGRTTLAHLFTADEVQDHPFAWSDDPPFELRVVVQTEGEGTHIEECFDDSSTVTKCYSAYADLTALLDPPE